MLNDDIMGKVKDTSGKLDLGDYLSAASDALARYSRVSPLELVADLTGNGAHDYDLPAGWVDKFSAIVSIEYPVGMVPEIYLDRRDYKLYATPAGKKLRIMSAAPDATETMRVIFTAIHAEDTAPVNDLSAISDLGAAIVLRKLAAVFLNTSDPLIAADVVNYRSKSGEALKVADKFEKLFEAHLGIGADAPVSAACAVTSQQDEGPVGLVHLNSRVRMTHGRRS